MTAATPWPVRMTETVMQRDPILGQKWAYEWGVVLGGIEQVWRHTGDPRCLAFIRHTVDQFVQADGSIRTYRIEEYNIDQIKPGTVVLELWRTTHDPRYEQAARLLRRQLETHPRTSERGFWHKAIYPHQMWLDGIYMHGPFYAAYSRFFDDPAGFDDVTHQIALIERHTRDERTGLLYHGWDETRTQRWANPDTGCSPHFWGRAMGWYLMAIPDVLDHLPKDHPQRGAMIDIFRRAVDAVAAVQDAESGLWYQVIDQGSRPGNYLEASASSMFIYAIAKGVRLGLLTEEYDPIARRAWTGLLDRLIAVDERGWVSVNQICSVAGLGGTPYRDGSFEYYIGEPVVSNDHKGVGAFILAGVEMELARRSSTAWQNREEAVK